MSGPLQPQTSPAAAEAADLLRDWLTERDLATRARILARHVFQLVAFTDSGNKFRVAKFAEIDRRLAELGERLANVIKLEQRLMAAIEKAEQFRYLEVWDASTQYRENNCVTQDRTM